MKNSYHGLSEVKLDNRRRTTDDGQRTVVSAMSTN